MSKEVKELYEKYSARLDLVVRLYKQGFSSFESSREELRNELHQFNDMRSTMFLYGLISEEDFKDTCELSYEMYDKSFNVILEIHCASGKEKIYG